MPEYVSGILGLSRKGTSKIEAGPLLINEMNASGKLENSMFSFYLTSNDDAYSSFIDFGMYVDDHIKFGSQLKWIKLVPHLYWMSEQAYGIRFNEQAFNFGKNNKSYSAIFDTGTSLTLVPSLLFD